MILEAVMIVDSMKFGPGHLRYFYLNGKVSSSSVADVPFFKVNEASCLKKNGSIVEDKAGHYHNYC